MVELVYGWSERQQEGTVTDPGLQSYCWSTISTSANVMHGHNRTEFLGSVVLQPALDSAFSILNEASAQIFRMSNSSMFRIPRQHHKLKTESI